MSTTSLPRLAVLTLAVHAALLLGACSKPEPAAVAPKPVRVQQVKLTSAALDESYTGAVRARVESDLAFRVGGKVIRRSVEVGQRVKAGDVIGELDGEDYGLGVAAAINQQQAAAVDAEQARSDAARFERLYGEGAVSQGDAERQRARADAARERLDQARRQVELARNRSAYVVLRSPFEGVVTALRFEAGQVVAEGQAVVTVAALGEREVVIDLPESRVLQAKRTPKANASLWAGDGTRFPITLRELSPSASAATRTYRARYQIGPDAPAMELGMTAVVWLGAAGDDGAPKIATLPAGALHQQSGRAAVWTVDPASRRPVLSPVQVVRYGQDDVQVTGLDNGSLVVTAGVQKLTVDMSVVAVDADGKPLTVAGPALRPDARALASTSSATLTR